MEQSQLEDDLEQFLRRLRLEEILCEEESENAKYNPFRNELDSATKQGSSV